MRRPPGIHFLYVTLHISLYGASKSWFLAKLTLNQGAIEKIFINALAERNILIDRPVRPKSLVLCPNDTEDQVYPITAILERLQQPPCANSENVEIVHAKFVIGADGERSNCGLFHKPHVHTRCTFMVSQSARYWNGRGADRQVTSSTYLTSTLLISFL